MIFFFFFFNDTATTEIYTLSLHDALPICKKLYKTTEFTIGETHRQSENTGEMKLRWNWKSLPTAWRSEEHTSELQSRLHLVCRLLLEKKKKYRARSSPDLIIPPNTVTVPI